MFLSPSQKKLGETKHLTKNYRKKEILKNKEKKLKNIKKKQKTCTVDSKRPIP